MVNVFNVMMKPYMMAGNLAKNAVCGAGDLIDNACNGRNNNKNRGACCGVTDVIDNLNPCHRGGAGERDESESSPLRNGFFGGNKGKNTKYEDYTWRQLPRGARDAAETLGLNEGTWNAKGWSSCDEYDWWDLSASQKEAATTLGWDESAWDYQYEDKSWYQLPNHVQEAAKSIGFTEGKWENDEYPYVYEKYWDSMTTDEQKALHVLGHTRYNWE